MGIRMTVLGLAVLVWGLPCRGAPGSNLVVIVTGGRTVSAINYGTYPYRPTTNYEYSVRITIPSLHYTNEIQRTSAQRLTYGQVTNHVAGRLHAYAATRGINTNNLSIQFRRPQ